MANKDNLIPNDKRTPSERRENARKAGIASGAKRRQQKTYREMAKAMLEAKVDDEELKEIARSFGIKNPTVKELTLLGMIRASIGGSHLAFDRLLDLTGEKDSPPDDNFNESIQTLADLINNPAPNRNIADFEGDDDA